MKDEVSYNKYELEQKPNNLKASNLFCDTVTFNKLFQ